MGQTYRILLVDDEEFIIAYSRDQAMEPFVSLMALEYKPCLNDEKRDERILKSDRGEESFYPLEMTSYKRECD